MRLRETILPVLGCIIILAAGCNSKKVFLLDVPKKIQVVMKGMIYVNEFPDSKSKVIGVVKYGQKYEVVDAWPGCYKIRMPDDVTGWIWANQASNWTKIVDENTIKIMLPGGLAVKKEPFDSQSPSIGMAAPSYTFEVLQTEFNYYKVMIAEGKAGWVYAGRPNSRWVIPAR